MGGDVWYERRFPTGARFCYSLPLRRRTILEDGTVEPSEAEFGGLVELPEEALSA